MGFGQFPETLVCFTCCKKNKKTAVDTNNQKKVEKVKQKEIEMTKTHNKIIIIDGEEYEIITLDK